MALSSIVRMVKTFTALPSVPAISPQASLGNSRSPCSTISLAKRVSSSIIAIATTVAAGPYSLNRRSVRREPALDGDVARLAGLGEAALDGLDPPLHQAKPHVLGVGGGDQQATGRLGVGQDELLGFGELPPVHEGLEIRVVALRAARHDVGPGQLEHVG